MKKILITGSALLLLSLSGCYLPAPGYYYPPAPVAYGVPAGSVPAPAPGSTAPANVTLQQPVVYAAPAPYYYPPAYPGYYAAPAVYAAPVSFGIGIGGGGYWRHR